MTTTLLIAIAYISTLYSISLSEDGPETSKRYDFLLSGMDDQRQRLRTGVYRVSGRYYNNDPALGQLDGPVTIFSAFDYNTNKFRFDRSEPIREGKIIAPGAESKS